MKLDLIKLYIEYHIETTRRVWDSIEQITEEQFLANSIYSHGSIRNLMVHLTSVERRWLAGLKNGEDVPHLKQENYDSIAKAREIFEVINKDLGDYVINLAEEKLNQPIEKLSEPTWQILLHLVNHGTDHRAIVLHKLTELGAPTFEQDFILWLWNKK
ncbi:MAG TPA: hypothetical protein DIW23_07830 [Anaerolineae bacterium]|nr:hypothetical protein [Anaerolineae bacterium]